MVVPVAVGRMHIGDLHTIGWGGESMSIGGPKKPLGWEWFIIRKLTGLHLSASKSILDGVPLSS